MSRFFLNIILASAIILLTGCGEGKKPRPAWKGIKIDELAPVTHGSKDGSQLLNTINFKAYILELPAENTGALDAVWSMLYTRPVRFNDAYVFKANSFSVGAGQMAIWDKITEQLDNAGAKVEKTVSLLLTPGEPDDIIAAALMEKEDIYYMSGRGSWDTVTIGPGTVRLRVNAEKLPGSRGICKVNAQPVFSPVKSRSQRLSGILEEPSDLYFKAVGFELEMSPGDFVLLGPQKYLGDETTLGGMLFSKAGREAAVRIYLLICTDIVD